MPRQRFAKTWKEFVHGNTGLPYRDYGVTAYLNGVDVDGFEARDRRSAIASARAVAKGTVLYSVRLGKYIPAEGRAYETIMDADGDKQSRTEIARFRPSR